MAASGSQVVRGRAGTYLVCQGIGKGAYGEVFLVKSKKDRKLVSAIYEKCHDCPVVWITCIPAQCNLSVVLQVMGRP